MAKTIKENYDTIVAEKEQMSSLNAMLPNIDNSQQFLTDLQSTSRVANWRLFSYIIAFAHWLFEHDIDAKKEEIREIAAAQYGNPLWYVDKALMFQFDDDVVVVKGVQTYAVVDVTKRIVKYAACTPGRNINVLVAKEGTTQRYAKLEPDELIASQRYFDVIKPAGEQVFVNTFDPDELNVSVKIYYNPLQLNGNGYLLSDYKTQPVNDAVKSHIENIVFNGILKESALEDSIQQAVGITDVVDLVLEVKFGNNSFEPISRVYQARSGWMVINEINVEYVADI